AVHDRAGRRIAGAEVDADSHSDLMPKMPPRAGPASLRAAGNSVLSLQRTFADGALIYGEVPLWTIPVAPG
ncbi:MAG TPA: hypothetical protein VLF15_00145, partial [Pseudoxanthomonas sp.]|nr:hypothetical protein [Pseudoxanthomonas sp.]